MGTTDGFVVTRVVRRHAAKGLTKRKRTELHEIARRWHQARDSYIDRFAHPKYASAALRRPRDLRELVRRQGWAPVDLTVHYHQTALLSAVGVIRGNWSATAGRVRELIGVNRRLGQGERHWLYYVLKSPVLLQIVLDGRTVRIERGWAGALDQGRLSYRLRRLMLRYRAPLARAGSGDWFDIDDRLYRVSEHSSQHFGSTWLSLTGVRRGSPVRIPLSGRDFEGFGPRPGRKTRPCFRVDVGDRIAFISRHVSRVQARTGDEAGIDKGFSVLLTLSAGQDEEPRSFGVGAGSAMADIAAATEARRKNRRRLIALARSLKAAVSAKARRLRRNNLGARKDRRRARRTRRSIRAVVDRSLNEMFASCADLAVLHCEELGFRTRTRDPRFLRLRLVRWLKGYLQLRLRYKAELNGVELNVVNAAYTSQTCPRCWYTSPENRRAERFECGDCGYTGSADHVAATNVLRRGRDPAISRYASTYLVKYILRERWRSARAGRAWDSNEQAPLEVVPAEDRLGQSREQLPHGSPPLGGSNSAEGAVTGDRLNPLRARSSAG
jgi:putative transposase